MDVGRFLSDPRFGCESVGDYNGSNTDDISKLGYVLGCDDSLLKIRLH